MAMEIVVNMLRERTMQRHTLEREHEKSGLFYGWLLTWGVSPKVTMWNVKNHQNTKQGAAYVMIGVKRYLSDNSKYDSVDFSILDGEDKVGKGGG